MTKGPIHFNWPYMTGRELEYIAEAHRAGHLAGDGPFTIRCQRWIEERTGCPRALLVHSCTAALEAAALLLDLQAGDEVIMPSYTFASTANAFVLRGAVPVFVDIREDTLNLDERLVEAAITPRTRAIAPVHYAGVACEMDALLDIARRHALRIVEDAAQGVMATYKGRPLGTLGDFGAYSFHETKNVISGEGGALLVNSAADATRAEIIREKGTDRSRFFRGQVDKYTWVDVGSSYVLSDLLGALLVAQLEVRDEIQRRRARIWHRYMTELAGWAAAGGFRTPIVPEHCAQSFHMFYLLIPAERRPAFIEHLKVRGVQAVFHYQSLHLSPMGLAHGGKAGMCPVTERVADELVRLPLYNDLTDADQATVIDAVRSFA